MDKHLPFWLALHHASIFQRRILHLLKHFSTPENLFRATRSELLAMGVSEKEIEAICHPNWQAVEKDIAWASDAHHTILYWQGENYPVCLKQISHPPLVLYVKGNHAALSHQQLAIVGARRATPTGLKNAEQFAYQLSQAGFTITSGLAEGIDSASHQGALAAKGETIAVFGTGLNHIYPVSNRKLVYEILDHQGALVSEFPLEVPPRAFHFPLRNRIIAGLSLGVLVVEAARKSGSLITVHRALEYGREVFAVPGSIYNLMSKGCHHLIKQGAKLVETVEDILEELGSMSGQTMGKVSQFPLPIQLNVSLEGKEKQIFDQIGCETTPIDMIILRTGLTTSEVSSILLSLELQGYIQTVLGGYIRIQV